MLLFLSHSINDEIKVSSVAEQLSRLGVNSFVAKHHLTPVEPWLPQLAHALMHADALVAFISSDFRASEWTDQEIGHALSRQVPVIPVQLDSTAPHGFIYQIQAIPAWDCGADLTARDIINALVQCKEVHDKLRYAMLTAVRESRSVEVLSYWLERLDFFCDHQTLDVSKLQRAARSNPVIPSDPTLCARVGTFLGRRSDIEEH